MERVKYILLALIPSLFLLFACEKDTTPTAFTSQIELGDPTDAGRTYIRLHGQIPVLDEMSEAGFVYWKAQNADDSVKIAYNSPSIAKIDAWLEGLEGNESYDYYMYIENGTDRIQSAIKNFRTLEKGLPLISEISTKTDTPTVFSARVKDDGVADGLEHLKRKGICWNTEGAPTVEDLIVLSEGDAAGFDVTISNLQDSTTYYLRAFAENNNSELAYGPELKIETKETLPQLGEILVIDIISKAFASKVTNEGGSPLLSKGFCWSTAENPTVEEEKLIVEKDFTAILEALKPGTTYHIRAFAENAYGVAYSEAIEIHTPSAPILSKPERTDTETNTFRSKVTNNGGSEILEYGFCLNQTGNPVITDKSIKCEEADFITSLGELEPGTYYIRAYAISKVDTGYSDVFPFVIEHKTPPEVENISQDLNKNILQSSVLQDGGSEITEWGFCWSSDNTEPPTIYDERVKADDQFVTDLDALHLEPGVYYVRAYAINKVNVGYSQTLTITISEKTVPLVGKIFQIADELNTFISSVKNNGGNEILTKGFCWNNNDTKLPTVDDYKMMANADFTASLGELDPGTYYVRAYAINDRGVGYSDNVLTLEIGEISPTSSIKTSL